jgi:pimeloyl-ACP methyl ester carboxylesterase
MSREEAEAMARAVPGARLVVIPDANHYTILDGTDPRLPAALGDFLATP